MGSGAFLVEACRQLGDALVEAWHAHGEVPVIPPDEDEVIFARRLVAQRCLYGVDRNPVAVDLAKVSLWLVTLAKDHALTFVDHALRHGDSLVGLSRKQIEALQWERTGAVLRGLKVREPLDRVFELRRQIREADETVSDWELRDLWDEAQFELGKVRLFGDLVLSAFFEAKNPRAREQKRADYANAILSGDAERYRGWLEEWRRAEKPFAPFHWEIEFPEVFERESPGFDTIVGNPPFAGKNTISGANVAGYPAWLHESHVESHGNADLVAHFFRRAFDLVRKNGTFGLIATNTIGQGDTRTTGLCWICQHGAEIFAARKRLEWPGLAAVVVSVVHVIKGPYSGPRRLDGREVETITAFLFHRGGHEDPARLLANAGKSYMGSYLLGMGFTFDDTDPNGIASPLAEMRQLIKRDPRNSERIFPYIGGAELNESPSQCHHRYTINFEEMSKSEASQWPDLMTILEKKVKPEREKLKDNPDGLRRKRNWWLWGRYTPSLFQAVAGLERVLATSYISQHRVFAFLPSDSVYAITLAVFPLQSYAAFCALQVRPHEIWARFFGSSLEDRLRYTPTDCFETFPFPENWEAHPALEAAGKAYYEFRACAHGPEQRGPDQDLQPLPRSRGA